MRLCRKCDKVLPLSSFRQKPKRHTCINCSTRTWLVNTDRINGSMSWEKLMYTKLQWDSKKLFCLRHRLRPADMLHLPTNTQRGDVHARVVPIDPRGPISVYNAIVAGCLLWRVLHECYVRHDLILYKYVMTFYFPQFNAPGELIME